MLNGFPVSSDHMLSRGSLYVPEASPAGWAELPLLGTEDAAPLEKAKEDGSWRTVPPPGQPKGKDLKARSWAWVGRVPAWEGEEVGRAAARPQNPPAR